MPHTNSAGHMAGGDGSMFTAVRACVFGMLCVRVSSACV